MSDLNSRYHTKNRIVAVDIVRILAAFVVMYEHLPAFANTLAAEIPDGINLILGRVSPLFFLLAGFFACRNLTWKKACNNAWWTFAPFVLWNTICILIYWSLSYKPEHYNIFTLFGVLSFFHENWILFPEIAAHNPVDQAYLCGPVNAPLWFMRDLVLLFLLSPILFKWARIIFPICLIASFIPQFSAQFLHTSSGILLSPRSLSFFTLGCLLQTLSKENQQKLLSFYSPYLIVAYFAVVLADFLAGHILNSVASLSLCRSILSIWITYQIARWIEVRIPFATPFALKFAPITFLTFATHMILFTFSSYVYHYLSLSETNIHIITPFITFGILSIFFFAMKRWCPCLLHLVAHYKLRPDDIKTPQAPNTAVTTK